MGFLSGVLSNIKEHLGQHKDAIQPAIDILREKKHSGKNGFNAAIEKVVAGVGRYNDGVRNSNNHVKSKITDLDSQMKKLKQSVSEDLKHNAAAGAGRIVQGSVDSADQLLKTCLSNADKFNESLDSEKHENVRNAINDLNSIVRDNVNKARVCVKLETAQFTALSSKQQEDRKVMREKIERCLTDLGTCVNDSIKRKVKNLVDDLSKKVSEIKRQLEEIKKQLIAHIGELTAWIDKAEPLINSAFEKVEEILKEVNEGDSQKRPFIINAAVREIGGAVLILHGAGEVTRQKVTDTVKAALEQVKEMNDELKKDLYTAKQAIKEAITALGETLKKNVNQDLMQLEGGVKKAVTEYAKGYVKKVKEDVEKILKGNPPTDGTGLEGIENVVKQYAEKFTKYQFEQEILPKWIEDISKKEPVKGYVKRYVTKNKTNGLKQQYCSEDSTGTYTELNKKITHHIADNLKSGVLDKVNVVPKEDDITGNIDNIGGVCRAFATALEQKTKDGVLSIIMGKIATDKELRETSNPGYDPSYLRHAVEAILNRLPDRARMTITEFEWLIGDKAKVGSDSSIAKEIDGAKSKATTLFGELGRGLENEGSISTNNVQLQKHIAGQIDERVQQQFTTPSPDAAFKGQDSYQLKTAMKSFNGTYEVLFGGTLNNKSGRGNVLDEEIGGDGMLGGTSAIDSISDFASGKFQHYTKQVNQDTLALLNSTPDELKGDLPEKVIEIKKQVLNALEKIDGEKVYAQQEIDKITANLHQLCQNVKAAGEHAQGSLKQLQDTYFNTSEFVNGGIRIIKYKLNMLQDTDLSKAINETTKFLTEAEKIREQTVGSLKIDVDNQVQSVKKQLTSELEKHYITTMALQLDNFADRITAHLKGLPEAIEKDKRTGFKGFMEAFEGKPKVKPREKWAIHVAREEPSKLNAFTSAVTRKQASKKEEFKTLSEEFKKLYGPLNTYLIGELKRHHTETMSNRNPSVRVADGDPIPHTKNVGDLKGKLDAILEHLHGIPEARKYLFDHNFSTKLNTLEASLDNLRPASYAEDSNPLLECLRKGVQGMCEELDKAYVNRYDGETITWDTKLSTDGTKCARILMTILDMILTDLDHLKEGCNTKWSSHKIVSPSGLRDSLGTAGYKLSPFKTSQVGELTDGITGDSIRRLLNANIRDVDSVECFSRWKQDKKITRPTNVIHVHEFLHQQVTSYYRVCHYGHNAASRTPCSIYEMLLWCCGLTHTSVYNELLFNGVKELYDKQEKRATEETQEPELTVDDPTHLKLEAYPRNITHNDISNAIIHVTTHASDVLTTILGFGDAYTLYACDYYTNVLMFRYPSDPSQCFEMLVELLRRMFPPLKFLLNKCGNPASDHGWLQCTYGRDISITTSPCNDHATTKPTSQPNCKPKSQPMCRPASPLMSYLNDCLPGHMPHHLTDVGCQSKCTTCPVSRAGMPCLTPLGFRAFSGYTKTGKEICEALGAFFDNGNLSGLFCVLPKPPATLPEHFGFVLSLVGGWRHTMESAAYKTQQYAFKTCFESTITDVSIYQINDTSHLTNALTDAYGSDSASHKRCNQDHLISLTASNACASMNSNCAPYLNTLCSDLYESFAKKHSNLYLSWAVYLPWTLYQYLESLRTAFVDIICRDWGCRGCLRGDICYKGKHGLSTSSCHCSSIVECKGVSPTMYQYGFCLKDVTALNAVHTRRTCFSFQKQLKRILRSQYFQNLFSQCDKFLFKIREPFIWFNVALWLLSLFYLLHIMVIRLDLLHIKSHLHSPSSHRIAAQSLLAAARVSKLNRVFYLQP